MELKKYKLEEIAEIIPGYAFKSSDFGHGKNIAIKIKDIVPPGIDIKNADTVDVHPGERYQLQSGDYVMAMTGATIGKIGKIGNCEKRIFINQRVCKFIANNLCDKEYLYYVLNSDYFQKFVLNNIDSKLAQPNIGHPTLYKFENLYPTLLEQKRIASVLSNIDSKIELNRAINQNLEAMAKQLYDYWFVQFDFPDENGRPYKSSGGEMVWNEKLKRKIPASWENKNIEDIADVYNGATPSTINEQNYGGDIVWITPKDLSDQNQKFVYQGERNISQAGYNSCSTHLLPPNTILMSSRAPIGLLSIAKTELCTNQGFKSFVPKAENISTYLYYYLNIHIKQIEQLGTGTTFKEVSREDVLKFPILKPSDAILDLLEKQVSALNNKQFVIQKENEFLTKQRDELLPLLMNGQVSVNSDLSAH